MCFVCFPNSSVIFIVHKYVPDIALLPGGVPIILKNGYHLGGVGVSGSSGSNDEKCAFRAIEKGLEAIYE